MLKKVIKYTDFDGMEREEPFYFSLNKAELWDMEYGNPDGGIRFRLQSYADNHDVAGLMKTIKEFISASYGEKSANGRRFIKSKELSEAFTQTNAFAELYLELVNDSDALVAFLNGVIPVEMQNAMQAKKEPEEQPENVSLLSDAPVKKEETEGVSLLSELNSGK